MESQITREAAWELLRKYNKDSFHLQHALTVEGVMRWYAEQLGFADEVDFWGMVGLLHDIDFELYPEEHCVKAPELLREGGVGEDMIHAICSHAYGLHVDVKPVAAGCSREVIEQGAEMLGWPLDEVLQKTLDAMRGCEARVASEMEKI